MASDLVTEVAGEVTSVLVRRGTALVQAGDEVEIEVIEITPEEVDAPSHVIREKECTVPSPDENEDDPKIWEQKLYDYLQYKKILEDEGLIERE